MAAFGRYEIQSLPTYNEYQDTKMKENDCDNERNVIFQLLEDLF